MISPPRLGLNAGARVRPGLKVEVSHASPAIAITGRFLVDIGDLALWEGSEIWDVVYKWGCWEKRRWGVSWGASGRAEVRTHRPDYKAYLGSINSNDWFPCMWYVEASFFRPLGELLVSATTKRDPNTPDFACAPFLVKVSERKFGTTLFFMSFRTQHHVCIVVNIILSSFGFLAL